MWSILFHIVLAVLVILGLTEVFRLFLFWLLKTKRPGRLYWVLSLHGHDEEAETALRCAVERLKWISGSEERHVICVDRGMDEETKGICDRLEKEMPVISVCKPEEIGKMMEQ